MRFQKANPLLSTSFKFSPMGFIFVLILMISCKPAYADDSTFQNTCRNIILSFINLTEPEDGVLLKANCQNEQGEELATEIELTGIDNKNGKLTVSPQYVDRQSTFQLTCDNIAFTPNDNQLFARCKKEDDSFEETSVRLQDISNNNGTLIYSSLEKDNPPKDLRDEL
jgi:hypothetical protein